MRRDYGDSCDLNSKHETTLHSSKCTCSDRTHPLEIYNDRQVFRKFRFPRHVIFDLAEELQDDIEYTLPRKGSLSPLLQVCLTLRFFATASFQSVVGDLIGIEQSTACRTIHRVTAAFMPHVREWIKMPTQAEADRQKQHFYAMRGFPSVFVCIDSTHGRIQSPHQQEHEFVNRKNFQSINTQVKVLYSNAPTKWNRSRNELEPYEFNAVNHTWRTCQTWHVQTVLHHDQCSPFVSPHTSDSVSHGQHFAKSKDVLTWNFSKI